MPQLTPDEWAQIRVRWEAGMGPRELAKQHGVHHTVVARRAQREEWKRDAKGEIELATVALIAKPRSTTPSTKGPASTDAVTVLPLREEVVLEEAERRAARLRLQQAEWDEVRELRQDVLVLAGDARSGDVVSVVRLPDAVDTYKKFAEATATAQKAERAAWGIDHKLTIPGDPTGADLTAEGRDTILEDVLREVDDMWRRRVEK